jgi:hypothetical protein
MKKSKCRLLKKSDLKAGMEIMITKSKSKVKCYYLGKYYSKHLMFQGNKNSVSLFESPEYDDFFYFFLEIESGRIVYQKSIPSGEIRLLNEKLNLNFGAEKLQSLLKERFSNIKDFGASPIKINYGRSFSSIYTVTPVIIGRNRSHANKSLDEFKKM